MGKILLIKYSQTDNVEEIIVKKKKIKMNKVRVNNK